jgi:hypothetical protein
VLNADSNTHTNSYCDSYSHCDSDRDCYGNCHRYRDCYSYCNRLRNGNSDIYSDSNANSVGRQPRLHPGLLEESSQQLALLHPESTGYDRVQC